MDCSCYCPCDAALVGPRGPTGTRGPTGPAGPPPSELTFLAPLSESGNNVSIAEDVYVLTDATPQTVAGTKRFDRFRVFDPATDPDTTDDYVLNLFENRTFILKNGQLANYISPTAAVLPNSGGGWCEATATIIWMAIDEPAQMCCYSASVCVAPTDPILNDKTFTKIWSTTTDPLFAFDWVLYSDDSDVKSVVLQITIPQNAFAEVSSSVRLTYTRVAQG